MQIDTFNIQKHTIMFTAETYIRRREALRSKVQSGIILLLGNNEAPANYPDNTYKFRQDSTFLYFFGHSHPGYAGVLDIETGEDIFFGNDVDIDDIIWMGPQPSIKELAAQPCHVHSFGKWWERPSHKAEKYISSLHTATIT